MGTTFRESNMELEKLRRSEKPSSQSQLDTDVSLNEEKPRMQLSPVPFTPFPTVNMMETILEYEENELTECSSTSLKALSPALLAQEFSSPRSCGFPNGLLSPTNTPTYSQERLGFASRLRHRKDLAQVAVKLRNSLDPDYDEVETLKNSLYGLCLDEEMSSVEGIVQVATDFIQFCREWEGGKLEEMFRLNRGKRQ